MKISVAVCTYNGEKYLPEQLNSYAAQIRLPDEVVICDDGSTDSTRDILTAFSASAPFSVKLCFNEENLGYVQNFGKAAGLCTGDIIAFSDQDDVWHQEKLKIIEAEFVKFPNVGMVYADAEVVDENLQPLGTTMWKCNNLNQKKQTAIKSGKSLDLLLRDGYTLGSSMAFRAKFLDLALPIPTNIYFDHDDWIALIISALADVSLISKPLIKYRQHRQQTSAGMKIHPETGVKPLIEAGRRINNYDEFLNQLTLAEKTFSEKCDSIKEVLLKISAARNHLLMRANLPKNPFLRSLKISRELIAGHYHSYSNGFRSAAKDLMI